MPNERILANAAALGHGSKPLIVRTPIIPGVNDTVEDVAAIAGFVADLPSLEYYELLPYHPMAASKYRSLDQAYDATDLKPPAKAQMAALAEVASQAFAELRQMTDEPEDFERRLRAPRVLLGGVDVEAITGQDSFLNEPVSGGGVDASSRGSSTSPAASSLAFGEAVLRTGLRRPSNDRVRGFSGLSRALRRA